MTENSLITLYCIVDDFIHRFLETSAGKKNLALYYGRHGPKRRMTVVDVVPPPKHRPDTRPHRRPEDIP